MSSAVINLVTGINGSGKTLWLLQHVEELRKASKRKVYYFAIKGIKEKGVLTEWEEIQPYDRKDPALARLNDPMALWSYPQGSIFVIDECHKTYPNRKQGSQVPPWVEPFAEARHDGFTFFFVTQDGGDLDIFIRRRVGKHYHLKRAFGMERSTLFQWEVYKNPSNKTDIAEAQADAFPFPKNVYDWYISSDDHQVKKTIPWKKLKWLLILPVGAVVLMWYAISRLHHGTPEEPVKNESVKASAVATADAPKHFTLNPKAEGPQWAAKLTERVQGQPMSAPMYDDTYKAVTFPRISGCSEVITNNHYRCTCNTQQATTITTMSALQCQFYVKNGWFDPNKPDEVDDTTVRSAPAAAQPVAIAATN